MLSTKRLRQPPPPLHNVPKPSFSTPAPSHPGPSAMTGCSSSASVLRDVEPPTSPALSSTSVMSSVSWAAEKSAAELVSILKNTFSALREKEKDLTLAAEIGKSLLESNMSLKTQYEELLEKVQHCQQEQQQQQLQPLPLNHLKHPRPSKSTPQRTQPDQQQEYAISDSPGSDHGDNEDDDDLASREMKRIPNRRTRDSFVESLEKRNVEMQQSLDRVLQESKVLEQSSDKRTRQLQHEIELLRSSLDAAAQKIQELEEEQDRGQTRARRSDERELLQMQSEDQARLQELTEEMAHLQVENEGLSATKKAVEHRLSQALRDLAQLRRQFEEFEFSQQSYEQLKDAYQRQFKHISELTESLEDHRAVMARLHDRGLWSPHRPPTSDCSTALSAATMTAAAPMQSLLGELEHAWQKDQYQRQQQPGDFASSTSSTPLRKHKSSSSLAKLRDLAVMTERNLSSFCHSPSEYALDTILASAGIQDRRVLDEAMQFLELQDDSAFPSSASAIWPALGTCSSADPDVSLASVNLYPHLTRMSGPSSGFSFLLQDPYESSTSQGIVGRILRLLRSLFSAVWRWCRFVIILVTAILINLWRGPDAILEKS